VAYDEDAIERLPDPIPLIRGLLDLGTVGAVTGFTGTAKSFLALDWGMCVAHGVPWMTGRDAGHEVGQGSVIYVAAEDGAGLKFRNRAWRKHHGVKQKSKINFYIQAVNLANDAQVDWLIGKVQADGAIFVLLDTYAKNTVGAEENSATDTARIVANCYRICNANGPNSVTVLIVHHTGWDKKRGRGSSGLPSDIDFVFNMEAENDDPHVYTKLKAVKRKNAQLPPPMGFQLVDVKGSGSCILQQVDVKRKAPTQEEIKRRERIDAIRAELEADPKISVRKIASNTGIPSSTVQDLLPQARI
jgi:RecA-family ATPase